MILDRLLTRGHLEHLFKEEDGTSRHHNGLICGHRHAVFFEDDPLKLLNLLPSEVHINSIPTCNRCQRRENVRTLSVFPTRQRRSAAISFGYVQ
jgi:hypothetical protein